MTGQGHHKGGAAFGAHRQQTHVAGGLSLRIAADNGQQRGIHGAGGGVRQTLPGVYKVAGLDLYAIGPLAAPEAEGVGDGAIAVLLMSTLLAAPGTAMVWLFSPVSSRIRFS